MSGPMMTFVDGWMESAATPEYIRTEVLKREIICYGGDEVSSLPDDKLVTSGVGTTFPSQILL